MKTTSGAELAKRLGISPARGMEASMKAQLITAVLKGVEAQHLTHAEVAKRSGLPRSAVTGILSGSLQNVTIDRVLRLVEAVGLVAGGHCLCSSTLCWADSDCCPISYDGGSRPGTCNLPGIGGESGNCS
jgi:predicted XRE-type DNA-binding protein